MRDGIDELREALLDVLALVLPVVCAGCGVEGRELCAACRGLLVPEPLTMTAPGAIRVVAGAPYREQVQGVVLAYKEGRTALAAPLAVLLGAALSAAAPEADVELCAVPASRAATRRRGFDSVRLVMARAGLRDARVLRPARPHPAQKGLGRDARAQNLRGAHQARCRLAGRRFLLVDDVVTTGATVAEVARAIRDAGGEVVGAVAIAATPLRSARGTSHNPPSAKAG